MVSAAGVSAAVTMTATVSTAESAAVTSAAAVGAVSSTESTAVTAMSATAVASGGTARRVRHSAAVRGCGTAAYAAAVSAVAATAVRVRSGEAAVSAVVGSVGRAVAAVVRSRCAATVRGIVVVTAIGSGVVVCRTVVVMYGCGGRGVVRSAVVCHTVVRCGVYVMHSSVVVRVVVSQVRVVVGAVVACGVRGSYPRSVNGHCPSEPDVHHRGVESQQLCHRNGVAAVVYPHVVKVHRCRNHLVGAYVVTVDPHFVAESGCLFPHIRGINVVHVVGIVGVVY